MSLGNPFILGSRGMKTRLCRSSDGTQYLTFAACVRKLSWLSFPSRLKISSALPMLLTADSSARRVLRLRERPAWPRVSVTAFLMWVMAGYNWSRSSEYYTEMNSHDNCVEIAEARRLGRMRWIWQSCICGDNNHQTGPLSTLSQHVSIITGPPTHSVGGPD